MLKICNRSQRIGSFGWFCVCWNIWSLLGAFKHSPPLQVAHYTASSEFKFQCSTHKAATTAVQNGGNSRILISIPVKLQDAVRRDPIFLMCCQTEPQPTPCSHFSCYFLHLLDTLPPSGVRCRTQGWSGVLSRPDRRCRIRLFRLTINGKHTPKKR